MTLLNKTLISVIIPTFNRRQVLGRAIDSVLTQTRPADEIIIIDDGSTDGTEAYVRETYPDLHYISQPNEGISHTRNQGIKASRGDWLAFLDSDDKWLPRKLEKQLHALNIQPQYNFCHTNDIWFRYGRRVNQGNKHEKAGGDIFERCLPLCVISPSST